MVRFIFVREIVWKLAGTRSKGVIELTLLASNLKALVNLPIQIYNNTKCTYNLKIIYQIYMYTIYKLVSVSSSLKFNFSSNVFEWKGN